MTRPGKLGLFAVGALSAVLWVVPSLGIQGMGTLGQRYNHADRLLVEGALAPSAAREMLMRNDSAVEAALAH